MKKVITYGTFDLFHQGHYNILKRAKEYGDYLIVGVTTDSYDKARGKLNIHDSLIERIENIKKTGLADQIIIEEYEGQKIEDIQKYQVDTFVIGSDWLGKFDYLKEFCNVIYLERTKGVSSTLLRNNKNKILKIGIIGTGRIAKRFVKESKYVSGIEIETVMSRKIENCKKFAEEFEIEFYTNNFSEFIKKVNAVYIATPHNTHYDYIKKSLLNNKHVLCEKPITLSFSQTEEIFELAKNKKLILLEAIKTAFCPGFEKLISIAKTGIIGEIKDVEACFTKLISSDSTRELDLKENGGSITELASYPLLAIIKLLGKPENYKFFCFNNENVDLYSKILLEYKNGIYPTAKVGLGVKSEGELIISGTKGYIYVPSPWWKTEYFEIRFEDFSRNKKYFYQFQEDGLRYEIAEFLSLINSQKYESYKLKISEIKIINKIIADFLKIRKYSKKDLN